MIDDDRPCRTYLCALPAFYTKRVVDDDALIHPDGILRTLADACTAPVAIAFVDDGHRRCNPVKGIYHDCRIIISDDDSLRGGMER